VRCASGVSGEIAIADVEAGRGLAQPFDDGGGNLPVTEMGPRTLESMCRSLWLMSPLV